MSAGQRSPAPRDEGAGTVLLLALVLVAASLALAAGLLARAAGASARAAAAADAAALAGADVLAGRADGPPCDRAAAAAGLDGAVLARCDVRDDDSVEVTALVAVGGPAHGLGPARARARAGPAQDP